MIYYVQELRWMSSDYTWKNLMRRVLFFFNLFHQKILSSKEIPITTNLTTKSVLQKAVFCTVLHPTTNGRAFLHIPEPLVKRGFLGQIKEEDSSDKSTIRLPRQYMQVSHGGVRF